MTTTSSAWMSTACWYLEITPVSDHGLFSLVVVHPSALLLKNVGQLPGQRGHTIVGRHLNRAGRTPRLQPIPSPGNGPPTPSSSSPSGNDSETATDGTTSGDQDASGTDDDVVVNEQTQDQGATEDNGTPDDDMDLTMTVNSITASDTLAGVADSSLNESVMEDDEARDDNCPRRQPLSNTYGSQLVSSCHSDSGTPILCDTSSTSDDGLFCGSLSDDFGFQFRLFCHIPKVEIWRGHDGFAAQHAAVCGDEPNQSLPNDLHINFTERRVASQ